jgi:uncharacterized repeat protein (TIGR01451 family)
VPEGVGEPSRTPVPEPPIADATVQSSEDGTDALGALSAPLINFGGLTSGSQPPDPTGDVGPNHFVQMVNATQFRVWDKAGNPLTGAQTFGNLWPVGTPCRENAGDPIVVYDHLADRWVLSQFRSNATNNGFCVAISQTPNPAAGTWFLYFLSTGAVFPDYPKFGVWPDGYYVTTFEFPNLGLYVMDRTSMLLGVAAGYLKTTISALTGTVRDTRILPADLDGPAPPSGTPGIFLRTVDSQQDTGNPVDRIEIYNAVVNWTTLTFTVTLVDTLTNAAGGLAPFNTMACNRNGGGIRDCIPVPQAAPATVDALSNRAMMQLKYRRIGTEQVLVVNQTINVQGALGNAIPFTPTQEVAGVRWYELREGGAGWTIRQQGTYAAQTNGITAEDQLLHRWMGSMAIDKDGNIALGYSITNSDTDNPVNPSISYTGRRFDDPLGLMTEPEQSIVVGATSPAGLGNRWGDYSQLGVDPVDDCTFWYTTHIANGTTRIASFRFDTCATDLEITKTGPPSVVAGGQLTYTITVANLGPINATNVTVVDTLPAGTSFVGSTDTCVQGPVGTLTCSLGTLGNGDSTSFDITVAVSASLAAGSSITNTASVSADQAELDPDNNTDSVTTLVTTSADIRLTKDCKPDASAPSGSTGACTIFVDNLGLSDAQNVVVTDTHFSNGNFTILSATFTPPPGSNCAINGGVVTCNLGTVPAGGRVTIVVQLTSPDSVDVNDTATVTSTTPDPNQANNIASDGVRFVATADLGITKVGAPDPVAPGDKLTYTITVANAGPSAALNVVVKDTVPKQLEQVKVKPSQGTCVGKSTITCNLGTIASGAQATIIIEGKVSRYTKKGTVLTNTASVSSATPDPNNANNIVEEKVTVQNKYSRYR